MNMDGHTVLQNITGFFYLCVSHVLFISLVEKNGSWPSDTARKFLAQLSKMSKSNHPVFFIICTHPHMFKE